MEYMGKRLSYFNKNNEDSNMIIFTSLLGTFSFLQIHSQGDLVTKQTISNGQN